MKKPTVKVVIIAVMLVSAGFGAIAAPTPDELAEVDYWNKRAIAWIDHAQYAQTPNDVLVAVKELRDDLVILAARLARVQLESKLKHQPEPYFASKEVQKPLNDASATAETILRSKIELQTHDAKEAMEGRWKGRSY